jgi:hypothetical protein
MTHDTPRERELRTPERTTKRLEEIARMTDLKKTVDTIISTARDYAPKEIYTATRYDPKTGKPTAYAWKPYGKIPAEAYVKTCDIRPDCINYSGKIKLSTPVLEELLEKGIENESFLITTRFGPHILSYEIDTRSWDGSKFTEHYIRIKEYKPLRNIDDIVE